MNQSTDLKLVLHELYETFDDAAEAMNDELMDSIQKQIDNIEKKLGICHECG